MADNGSSIASGANDQIVDAFIPAPVQVGGASKPMEFQTGIVAGAQNLVAFTVLGFASSGPNAGKYVLSVAAATDGSQVPCALTPENLNTYDWETSMIPEDVSASLIVSGGRYDPAFINYHPSFTRQQIMSSLTALGFGFHDSGYSG